MRTTMNMPQAKRRLAIQEVVQTNEEFGTAVFLCKGSFNLVIFQAEIEQKLETEDTRLTVRWPILYTSFVHGVAKSHRYY